MEPQKLSVCIASYGDDLTELLQELSYCIEFGLPDHWEVEILVSDQFPKAHKLRKKWEKKFNCRYIHSKTKGRSQNRNELAEAAEGTHLVFMDADALPKTAGFLNRYCNYAQNAQVIVGGTAYQPGFKVDSLRVKIGKLKEQITPAKRDKKPYASFSAFNFMIQRELFENIQFDPRLEKYGHEDTLFGQELRRRGATIDHIDNPAYHMGIDSGEVFMDKTAEAVDSLAFLIAEGSIDEEIRLFKIYRIISLTGLVYILRLLHKLIGNPIKTALARGWVPIFMYDFYKLLRLSSKPIKILRRMP